MAGAVDNWIDQKYDLLERAVLKIGLPTILIAIGLGFFAGWIPSPLSRMGEAMAEHQTSTIMLFEEKQRQTHLLRKICFALSKQPIVDCLDNAMASGETPNAPTMKVPTFKP